jgi:hypothetical protein
MSKGGSSYTYMPQFSTQNSSTTTTIPSWLTNAAQSGIGYAHGILNNGTPQYSGELAPGLTADQQAAQQMFQNSVGAFQPQYQQAQDYTNAATGQNPQVSAQTYANGLQNIGQYMNPYISNVVDSINALGQQNLQQSLNQTHDQAIGAGAFGGSRQGVAEGVATAQNNLNTNNLLANLLNSGYGQATSMLGSDISNNLTAQQANQGAYQNWMSNLLNAGSQTANNATAARAANVGDITNVQNAGTLAQQTQAAQDTAGQNMWQYQNQYPLTALQAYNSTVQGAPHDTTQNTTSSGWNFSPQQQQTSNGLMGGIGGALAGAQMGSSFGPWGTAIGAAGGGLLGAFNR